MLQLLYTYLYLFYACYFLSKTINTFPFPSNISIYLYLNGALLLYIFTKYLLIFQAINLLDKLYDTFFTASRKAHVTLFTKHFIKIEFLDKYEITFLRKTMSFHPLKTIKLNQVVQFQVVQAYLQGIR